MYVHLLHLGRIPYAEGLAIQARVVAARKAGRRGPLLGIPVMLKDNIDTTDADTTAGSIAPPRSFNGRLSWTIISRGATPFLRVAMNPKPII